MSAAALSFSMSPLRFEALMSDLNAFSQADCLGLRQSYGIGVDGAAVLLADVGDSPERIQSEAAFAAVCGASPLEARSVSKQRNWLNRGGNRRQLTSHCVSQATLAWQTKA